MASALNLADYRSSGGLFRPPPGVPVSWIFQPSRLLREYVRGYFYRDHHIADESLVRPVSAEANAMLVFALGDRCEAFEYATGTKRVLPEVMLVGPQTQRVADLHFSGRHHVVLVLFQPAGLNRLFGLPGCEFVDSSEDAALRLGPEFAALAERLRDIHARGGEPSEIVRCVDNLLASRVVVARSALPVHRAAAVLERSHGLADLGRLAGDSGFGARQFNRNFIEQMGMTPKRYARVARFGYALRLKLNRPLLTWADVSHEAGYYDQNHMVKEFRALVGDVPSVYASVMSATPVPLRSPYLQMSNSY